jgi:hypothetical protein
MMKETDFRRGMVVHFKDLTRETIAQFAKCTNAVSSFTEE